MTSVSARWRFEFNEVRSLPPLAWLARVDKGVVKVSCGTSVRIEVRGFFEGTWAGTSAIAGAARATTVFGSGIVIDGDELVAVPPAHPFEPIYLTTERDGTLVVANSFVCLLQATGRELDPGALYPPLFGLINRGLSHGVIEIPTTTDPITVHYFENIRIARDGSTTIRPKPRERPFVDFADYRDRLRERLRSTFENSAGYSPVVALSSGYDSTATAAVAVHAGCHRASTFRSAWPWAGYSGEEDSGESTARILGLDVQVFDRLAYQQLPDAPEAEFLATGMTGEDVVQRSMETSLTRSVLLTGYWGGAAWRGYPRANLSRLDLSGASLGEFRLRADFIHLPMASIGAINQPNLLRIRASPEMRPYSVGGRYDEPVARRLAEEAGVPRGTFAVQKRAASQLIHRFGVDALSPSGRASFERFAGSEALASLPRRDRIGRRHRAAIKIARALRADGLVAGVVERKWRAVHIEPVLGSLLLRWAVEEIRPRYLAVAREPSIRD